MFVCAFAGTIPNSVPVHQRERPDFSRLDKLKNYIDIMKRIACLIALLLVSFAASAQKIAENEIDEKGNRVVKSDMFMFGKDLHSCALSYINSNGTEKYTIILGINEQNSRWTAAKGQELMIKTANSEVLSITSIASKCSISRSVKTSGVCYITIAMYSMTPDEAAKIQDTFVKFRIHYTHTESGSVSFFDMELPEEFGERLKKAYANIQEALKLPPTVDKSVF